MASGITPGLFPPSGITNEQDESPRYYFEGGNIRRRMPPGYYGPELPIEPTLPALREQAGLPAKIGIGNYQPAPPEPHPIAVLASQLAARAAPAIATFKPAEPERSAIETTMFTPPVRDIAAGSGTGPDGNKAARERFLSRAYTPSMAGPAAATRLSEASSDDPGPLMPGSERLFQNRGAAPTTADLEGRIRTQNLLNQLSESRLQGRALDEVDDPLARMGRARARTLDYERGLPYDTTWRISSFPSMESDLPSMDTGDQPLRGAGPTIGEMAELQRNVALRQAEAGAKMLPEQVRRDQMQAELDQNNEAATSRLNQLEALKKTLDKTTYNDKRDALVNMKRELDRQIMAKYGVRDFADVYGNIP